MLSRYSESEDQQLARVRGQPYSRVPSSGGYHFIYQFSEWTRVHLRHHPSIFLEFTNCEQYTITIKPITRMNLVAAQMTALPSKRGAGNRNPELGTQSTHLLT